MASNSRATQRQPGVLVRAFVGLLLASALTVELMFGAVSPVSAGRYSDDFSVDDPGCSTNPCTSGNYRYSGFNGDGFFDIAGGTLNLTTTSGFLGGTKAVVLDDGTHFLDPCERASVEVPGGENVFFLAVWCPPRYGFGHFS